MLQGQGERREGTPGFGGPAAWKLVAVRAAGALAPPHPWRRARHAVSLPSAGLHAHPVQP
jgi:hypothetical protein